MYLMEGPTQYAALNRWGSVVTTTTDRRRRRRSSQLGSTAKTATSAGAGVATSILAMSPATGPAAPFVAAAAGIIQLLTSLFSWHGDPRDPVDADAVEAGLVAVYNIWYVVSGEAIVGAGDPQTNTKNPATWSLRTSAYPNVPNGQLGDTSVNIDQAIASCQEIIDQVASQLVDPGSEHYNKSLQNPFFTNGGGGAIALLQQVKAAREAAAVKADSSPSSTFGLSAASIFPIAAVGILLYTLSSGENI